MATHRDSEITLWRFGIALMGGRSVPWMVFAAFIFGWLGAVYVATHASAPLGRGTVTLTMAAFAATGAFLALPVAAAQLWVQQLRHPLLRLAPGGKARLRKLLLRVALLAVIAFIPALMLRVFVTALSNLSLTTPVTLSGADAYVWRAWALYLLAFATLILFAGCTLRVPLGLAAAPIYMVGMQYDFRNWWMPAIAVVVIIGLPWLYRRMKGNPVRRQPRTFDDNVFAVSGPLTFSPWVERWRTYRLRRTFNATRGTRATSIASLAGDNMWLTSFLATGFLAASVVFMQPISPSWWGAPTSFFFGMIAAFVTMPGPVTLTPVWVLPVGQRRETLGETLVAVWLGRARMRIAVGVGIGMLILPVLHLIDPGWPVSRTNMYGERSVIEKLLWAPLGLAVAMHGLAYAMYVLLALSPTVLARRSLLRLLPALLFLATPIVAIAGMFLATALGARWHETLSPFTIYLLLFGAVLPALAWFLLRVRRRAWRRADLAAISGGMSDWSQRIPDAWRG